MGEVFAAVAPALEAKIGAFRKKHRLPDHVGAVTRSDLLLRGIQLLLADALPGRSR